LTVHVLLQIYFFNQIIVLHKAMVYNSFCYVKLLVTWWIAFFEAMHAHKFFNRHQYLRY